ncbi:chemotaxis protein CheX [Paraglaciecola arctica]|uniref:Chemotaxis protein CheX n=1 Tax=Paraglaciecola arctica BSs20135 TaxID=493475 RepID=K6YPA7_9ALTE|nr:chemotaxis protein CheX [Paraglaciecola arctica]GAC20012.1 chemotaxis protein CheX [Paraglaciecola arctica BSs20135]|tara:strand:- start:389 stop:853 length:465 start_codon:yes stop_codon:yes gene_type:complete
MNAEFINPFIAALLNVLKTMAQTELIPGKPKKKSDKHARGDISGLIGMVGDNIQGSMSISFEEGLVLEIMNKMLGEKPESIDSDVQDMVGEITNMICGGAKNELDQKGYDFGMATPIVISGKNHTINHQVDGKKMVMPFSHESGNLYLEMCFNK